MIEAYEILSNPDKRRDYDAQGHQSYKSSSNQDGFSGFHFNMHDFFKEFDEASAKFHYSQHAAHHEAHQRAHQQAHQRTHDNAFGFDFGSLFDDDDGFEMDVNNPNEGYAESSDIYGTTPNGDTIHVHRKSHTVTTHQHCKTVTRREGKKVSTITECT
jgi:curved DNA-binding protein CbpA